MNSNSFKILSKSYYHIFAKLYSFVGSQSELIMVNSSWTLGHINSLWKKNTSTFLVYPPCNTKHSLTLPLNPREPVIISIGQFRFYKFREIIMQINNSFSLDLKKIMLYKYVHFTNSIYLLIIILKTRSN